MTEIQTGPRIPDQNTQIQTSPTSPTSTSQVEPPSEPTREQIIQEKLEAQPHASHRNEASSVEFQDIISGKPGPEPLPPEREAVRAAGAILDRGYNVAQHTIVDSQEVIGVVSHMSQEERYTIANRLTQLDSLRETTADENRCGAACLTMACFYEGGHEGLLSLINGIENFNQQELPPEARQNTRVLDMIRDKLSNNQALNFADLSQIQEQLYQVLDHFEQVDRNNFDSGLSNRVIDNFFGQTPEVAELFDQNQIAMRHIDNMGDGYGNHFVLIFNEPAFVYDPYPRSNNNQITDDPDLLNAYQAAVDPRYGIARN